MRTKQILSLPLLFALMLCGCRQEDFTYQGPQYYEFGVGEKGQTLTGGIVEKENGKIGLDSICVQIIKPADRDIVVQYEIVSEIYYLRDKGKYVAQLPDGVSSGKTDTIRSSAVYGIDYTIRSDGGTDFAESSKTGSLVIAKGQYRGYIPVDMKVKSGTEFFVLLKDSESAKANKPTALLRYIISPDKIFYLNESFSESLPDTWTLIDKDGDGFNWVWYKGAMTSDSYLDDEGAVTPENYLISPRFTIPAKAENVELKFDVAAGARNDYKEQYRVIVSESPITKENCRNAEIVRDWTTLTSEHRDKNFVTESIDMRKFIGKTVYIGFVHGNCTDQYYILLKNAMVYSY